MNRIEQYHIDYENALALAQVAVHKAEREVDKLGGVMEPMISEITLIDYWIHKANLQRAGDYESLLAACEAAKQRYTEGENDD